jgi:hypothetical protein
VDGGVGRRNSRVAYDCINEVHVNLSVRIEQDGDSTMNHPALAHDPEKCGAIFRKDHAQTKD